jgi:sulfate adenylyltransferase
LRDEFKAPHDRGLCLYFVGLSGSGKTTLARLMEKKVREIYPTKNVTYLDGDIVRTHLSKGLGFSKEDRSANVRRIGYVSSLVVKHGGVCVTANIAPYEEDRKVNRELIKSEGNLVQVWVNTPLEECEKRDVKGLYKLAREGVIKQFTGISDPFEEPKESELILDGTKDLEELCQEIISYLKENGYCK